MDEMHILERAGLTSGELKVYLALLDLGLSSTGGIIDKSQVSSSKVYLILERLEQKGLISHIIRNNVKYFQTADPKKILEFTDNKISQLLCEKKEIEKLLPYLQKKRTLLHELSEATLFQGNRGFKTARDEFIADLQKGNEYLVFGSNSALTTAMKNSIRNFHEDNEKKGIKTRLIYNINQKQITDLLKPYRLTQIRFVDGITPSSIAISRSRILLMAYGENPVQILIHNIALASSFEQFFNSIWTIGHH
jgi:sugar-specific transcriptional regulator TrmB